MLLWYQKGDDMNYINDMINIETAEAADSKAGQKLLGLDGPRAAACSWINVTAFDAETMTGLARSTVSGQLFAFAITGRTSQRGVVRAAAYALEDVSLSAGTMRADLTHRIGAEVNDSFLLAPNRTASLFD